MKAETQKFIKNNFEQNTQFFKNILRMFLLAITFLITSYMLSSKTDP